VWVKQKKISQTELRNFLNKLALSQDATDPEMLDFLNKLDNQPVTETSSINVNASKLADKIYDVLEIMYGDLVQLYGHEVVGDAIQEVVLQSESEINPNIETLAKQVLKILRTRLEEQLKETDNTDTKKEPKVDKKSAKDKEHHNAVIQIQADLDKIKNTLDIKESKIYFNVLATPDRDLRSKFKLSRDRKGWYLRENADATLKLDALRTFSIL